MTNHDYKTFFDDAPLALLRTDLETGKFIMANKFAASLLGCKTVEDLLEKKSSDFYSTTTRSKLLRKLAKTGEIKDQEIQMNVNGKRIWVNANLKISCDGTCIECFLSDITELVELREKELVKMKTLSEKIDTRMRALIT